MRWGMVIHRTASCVLGLILVFCGKPLQAEGQKLPTTLQQLQEELAERISQPTENRKQHTNGKFAPPEIEMFAR